MEQRLSPFKDRLFLSFLLLLIWIPLPLGSNRVFAWSMMEIAIFITSMIWLWQYRQGKREIPPACRKAWPALTILSVWLLYIGLQILPLPPHWIAVISPESAAMYALMDEANAESLTRWITISVAPDVTAQAFVKSIAYGLFFALTLFLVKSRTQLKWLGYALLISGVIQALYGTFMVLSGLEYSFFMEKKAFQHVATGTFINRNNQANFLMLCMSVGIGLLLAQLDREKKYSWRAILRSTLDWLLSDKMRLRFSLIIMAIALVMTHSRMGNAAFFISLLVAGTVSIMLSKRSSRSAVTLLASLVVLDLLVIGSMVGMDQVVERIEQTSSDRENRDEVAADTLNYWRDYRLTGSGLGNYYMTYPRYRSEIVSGFYNYAHNDYLQMAAETGIIGSTLLSLFVIATFWATFRALLRRHDPWCRGFAFTAQMAICAILIHATVDYNLQIPANSAYFMVILALAWVSFGLPSAKGLYRPVSAGLQNGTAHKKWQVPVLMILLSLLSLKASMWGGADLITSTSSYHMAKWRQEKKVDRSDWQQRFEQQKRAVEWSPDNFYARYTLGRLIFWESKLKLNEQGKDEPIKPLQKSTQQAIYEQMWQQCKQAIETAPANPSGWLLRAISLYYKKDFSHEIYLSLRNAEKMGPWEYTIQRGIISIGANSWDSLASESQEIVLQTVQRNFRRYPTTTARLIDDSPLKQVFCERLKVSETTLCASQEQISK
jgi:O-antigen ligase